MHTGGIDPLCIGISFLCVGIIRIISFFFFFFNDTATTEIYTLSLHDALPISCSSGSPNVWSAWRRLPNRSDDSERSEEHTSELQSRLHLVCRLLLEKKKKKTHLILHIPLDTLHDDDADTYVQLQRVQTRYLPI